MRFTDHEMESRVSHWSGEKRHDQKLATLGASLRASLLAPKATETAAEVRSDLLIGLRLPLCDMLIGWVNKPTDRQTDRQISDWSRNRAGIVCCLVPRQQLFLGGSTSGLDADSGAPPMITFFTRGRSTVGQMTWCKWQRTKCGRVKCALLV